MAANTLPEVKTSGMFDLAVDGTFAASDGIVYFLTECCKASAKGAERGVVCRSCYRVVDDRLGMAWLADSFAAEYPAWCAAQGLTEGTAGIFADYAGRVAAKLGL